MQSNNFFPSSNNTNVIHLGINEMSDIINNIFVNESSILESSVLNDSNEMPLNSTNGVPNQTLMQLSDDESTMTIGEITIDEHFDDTLYDNDVFEETNVDQVAPSSSIENDSTDTLVNTFENSQTTIVLSREIRTFLISVPQNQRSAIIAKTVVARYGSKRKRNIDEEMESNRNRLLYENSEFLWPKKRPLLKDFGIKVPSILIQNFNMDDHWMLNCNYISQVPATTTVHDILSDYVQKKNADSETMGYVLETFNGALPVWCLHRIEKLQYYEVVKKYPHCPMSKLYGLAHFIRFIAHLPKVFVWMNQYAPAFTPAATVFIIGFLDYMVEENLRVDLNRQYINVIPEYYRMTYEPIRVNKRPRH